MIRHPPRSTLFPYPTLFQPRGRRGERAHARGRGHPAEQERAPDGRAGGVDHHRAERSEEHTSELQSQSNLVCRLLLEKKNTEALMSAVGSLNAASWLCMIMG